jgi:hypothetical protein
VANARELRAISHSDRKSDQADAEKLARFARMDPKILRPISHRTIAQQEALTLIRARNLLVRLLDEQADLLHVNAGAPAMETRSRSVLARSSNSRIVVCAFGSLSGMSQI